MQAQCPNQVIFRQQYYYAEFICRQLFCHIILVLANNIITQKLKCDVQNDNQYVPLLCPINKLVRCKGNGSAMDCWSTGHAIDPSPGT